MPLDVNLKFLTPPDVEVVVTDVGGGGGSPQKLRDLVVSFDPAKLTLKSPGGGSHSKGTISWRKLSCPSNGKKVTIKLERKTTAKTFLVAAVMDPFLGRGKVRSKKVPAAFRASSKKAAQPRRATRGA